MKVIIKNEYAIVETSVYETELSLDLDDFIEYLDSNFLHDLNDIQYFEIEEYLIEYVKDNWDIEDLRHQFDSVLDEDGDELSILNLTSTINQIWDKLKEN